MCVVLIPLGLACHELLFKSGRLLDSHYDGSRVGMVLDQPTMGKWLFWFSAFTAVLLPYTALVRWISDRSTRPGYWTFAVITAAMCLCLLAVLTVPLYWLLQYIYAMGFTPRRVYGLLYGLSGYTIVLGFLYWATRRPKRGRDQLSVSGDLAAHAGGAH